MEPELLTYIKEIKILSGQISKKLESCPDIRQTRKTKEQNYYYNITKIIHTS